MAATLVQSKTGAQNTGLATVTASFDAATASGNLLVLIVGADDYAASPPTGWTQSTGCAQQTFLGHYVWWRVSNGLTSVQYTIGSAASSTWALLEYSGMEASPYDTSNGQFAQSASGSYTTPAIAPSTGERLVIGSIGGSNGTTQPTGMGAWTNSFVEVIDTRTVLASGTRDIIGAATRTVTGNGSTTYSTGATLDGVMDMQARTGIILSFKIAADGPPTADAGVDASTVVGAVFSRTAGEAANGFTITSRSWTIVSGPAGAGSTIGTAAALSWTPSLTGSYVLRYSATNSAGTGTDDATITVTDQVPTLVADRGSAQNLTAQTSTGVTLTSPTNIATGNYLIARVAVDNSGTNGAAPGCTVTDPRSNTWTVLGPALVDPGAAAAGATAYVAYAKVDTAYQAADALTFNWGGVNTTAKAVVVEEWQYIDATTPVAVATVTATGTASSALSVSITPTAASQLVYTCLAVEGPTGDTAPNDADTADGSWVALTRLSTTSGTATNNQTVNGAYKQVTGTSAQTWNSTITARDWAALAVVFAPPAAAVSQTVTPGVAGATGTAVASSAKVTAAAPVSATTGAALTAASTAQTVIAAAQGTGAVPAAGVSIAQATTVAQATGTVPAPATATSVSQSITAGVASSTGAVPASAASITQAATTGNATGAVPSTTTASGVIVAVSAPAAATGDAPDLAFTTAATTLPPTASGAGAAPDPTFAAGQVVTPAAAQTIGDAPDPGISSSPTVTPAVANSTGDTPDPTISTSLVVTASVATTTGDAPDPAATISESRTATATVATATGDARDPSVSVSESRTAIATIAQATGDAPDPSTAISESRTATPDTAQATGAVQAASASTASSGTVTAQTSNGVANTAGAMVSTAQAATAVAATATGGAPDPAVTISVSTGPASVTGQAFDAGSAGSSSGTATAQTATGTGFVDFDTAFSTSLTLIADNAVGATGQALAPSVLAGSIASPATTNGAGSAVNPTTTASGSSSTTVVVEDIRVYGTAQGATIDTQDGVAGPTQTALAQIATVSGSAFGPTTPIVVRPAGAGAQGRTGTAATMVLSVNRHLHAGTPVVQGRRVGTPQRATVHVAAVAQTQGYRAGEPVPV